jgi:EAL domain
MDPLMSPLSPLFRRPPRIDTAPIVELGNRTVVRDELVVRDPTDGLVVRVATLAAARGRRLAVRVPVERSVDSAYLEALRRAMAHVAVPAGGLALVLDPAPGVDPAGVAGAVGEGVDVIVRLDLRGFRNPAWNRVSRGVVADVVRFARDRGQEVLAAGIEDERTLDVVRELGVGLGQGLHLLASRAA